MKSRNFPDSFRHACAGMWYVLKTQRNARIHLIIAAVVIGLGLWLGLAPAAWALLALAVGFVLASEMLNTVAEALVDLVCPGYNPSAKVIKDVTAAAVLLSALTAVAVGLLVLGPPLWARLFGP